MTPITFPEVNAILAKDQPQYLPLPVWCRSEVDGEVVSCWKLTIRERLKLLITGRLWLRQLTFNDPLQPQLLQVDKPE